MKRTHTYLLAVVAAFLLIGFYTIDFQSNQASVFTVPEFSGTTDIKQAENQPAPSLQDFNDAIVNIADQTNPTVVTVTVTKTVERQQNPLSRFFGDPRGGGEPEQFQRRGLGSGVIVSQEGYILTNNHVIEGADEVQVELYNDQSYNAEIIGTDPQTDLAVLQIDADNLNVIELGDSDNLRVGEMVLAIGSPLDAGLAHSVSMGIVSAKERDIQILSQEAGYESFIQTDAAINPGNSGGALVDMNGELVGINTAIASRSGGNQGIGFAVPMSMAEYVMESIIEHGRVVRAYLGVSMGGEVDATMAEALDLDKAHGVIIGHVEEGGPADEAGLQEDDVIQTLNGNPIKSWSSFRTTIGTSSPGTEIKLGVNRDGEQQTMSIELGEMPDEMIANQGQPQDDRDLESQLGFNVQNLSPEIRRQLDLDSNQQGVIVRNISQGSSAYQQGLRKGHVIVEADRQQIENTSDFRSVINDIAGSDENVVLLRVIAGETSQLIAFEL